MLDPGGYAAEPSFPYAGLRAAGANPDPVNLEIRSGRQCLHVRRWHEFFRLRNIQITLHRGTRSHRPGSDFAEPKPPG
jgi:hypothetical protein